MLVCGARPYSKREVQVCARVKGLASYTINMHAHYHHSVHTMCTTQIIMYQDVDAWHFHPCLLPFHLKTIQPYWTLCDIERYIDKMVRYIYTYYKERKTLP